MKRLFPLVLGSALIWMGCASSPPKVLWREMLGKSIADFTEPVRDNNADRIWIKNMDDRECDKGCKSGVEIVSCGGDKDSGGAASLLPSPGGLFGLGGGDKAGPAPSPYDALAYEVFSNFLTQKRKGRVIESHHHNYMTEANPETHKKIEVIQEGKIVGTFSSCEDLCALDEAKKRRADKVLAYQILEMKADELLIHLRYSDVKSGMVELSRTLKVTGLSVGDYSF